MFRLPIQEDGFNDDLGPGGGGLPTGPPSGEGYAGGGTMLASYLEREAGFNWETCYVNNF